MSRATRWLASLSVVFLVALAWLRGQSGFLRAEARAAQARAVAVANDLTTGEVLALLELLGADLDGDALRAAAAQLAVLRNEFGDVGLAVLALRGRRALAERLHRAASGDPRRARELLRQQREAVDDAVRFLAVAERFAARGH